LFDFLIFVSFCVHLHLYLTHVENTTYESIAPIRIIRWAICCQKID